MTSTSDDGSRERAAKNESVFRSLNEQIESLDTSATFVTFVCECLDLACEEPVPLTLEEYEHVRADPNRFVVLPGHEVLRVDEIVEQNDRYLLVRKRGAGADVAEVLDPRPA